MSRTWCTVFRLDKAALQHVASKSPNMAKVFRNMQKAQVGFCPSAGICAHDGVVFGHDLWAARFIVFCRGEARSLTTSWDH